MQHRIEIGACPVGRLLVTHADDSLTIENVERPLRHAEGGTSDWVLRVADTETQIDISVGIRAGHGLSFTSSWRQS